MPPSATERQERNVYQLILDRYESFSKRQKTIADYVMTNLNNVIYFPIAKIVTDVGVSQATIVRFAQNLGYRGFQEFRDDLFAYYRQFLSPVERMKHSIEGLAQEPFSYAGITRNEMVYLESSIASISDQAYQEAVQAICSAGTVHIFGIGPDEPLAVHLHFRLRRLKIRTLRISDSGRSLFEHLLLVGREDLAVVYSFARPSVDFKRLTAVLAKKEVPVLLITDIFQPPMIRAARYLLCAERGPLGTFPSPLVPLAITNALILGVANRLQPQALAALEELGDLRDRYFYMP